MKKEEVELKGLDMVKQVLGFRARARGGQDLKS